MFVNAVLRTRLPLVHSFMNVHGLKCVYAQWDDNIMPQAWGVYHYEKIEDSDIDPVETYQIPSEGYEILSLDRLTDEQMELYDVVYDGNDIPDETFWYLAKDQSPEKTISRLMEINALNWHLQLYFSHKLQSEREIQAKLQEQIDALFSALTVAKEELDREKKKSSSIRELTTSLITRLQAECTECETNV